MFLGPIWVDDDDDEEEDEEDDEDEEEEEDDEEEEEEDNVERNKNSLYKPTNEQSQQQVLNRP